MYNYHKFNTNKKMRLALDNFSENESNEVKKEGSDIEFDESIDIDALQKNLQEQLETSDEQKSEENNIEQTEKQEEIVVEETEQPQISEQDTTEAEENDTTEETIEEDSQTPEIPKEVQDLPELEEYSTPKDKKYVIYIDGENVPFMENLTINDRKLIINKILKEQDEKIKREKALEQKRKKFINIIIFVITIIIGIPTIFLAINTSVGITVTNYKQSKQNFAKLYREHGKIKPKVPLLPAPPKV